MVLASLNMPIHNNPSVGRICLVWEGMVRPGLLVHDAVSLQSKISERLVVSYSSTDTVRF